jgi:hypothetical protein
LIFKHGTVKLNIQKVIIIIISLLMPPLLGHKPSLWINHKEHGGARDDKVLVTHPMTDH